MRLKNCGGNRCDAAQRGLPALDRNCAKRTGTSGETAYNAWMYSDWRGAYDLKALAQSVDLICLMTYDQHTRYTPPGPVAGYPWVVENIKYALDVVPGNKQSLGIPGFGYHWFASAPPAGKNIPNPSAEYIGTPAALQLAVSGLRFQSIVGS